MFELSYPRCCRGGPTLRGKNTCTHLFWCGLCLLNRLLNGSSSHDLCHDLLRLCIVGGASLSQFLPYYSLGCGREDEGGHTSGAASIELKPAAPMDHTPLPTHWHGT